MNGMRGIELYSGLICALVLSLACRAGEDWLRPFTWGFARRFTPGYNMTGFQRSKQRRIVAELDALQSRECGMKRVQAETTGRPCLHPPLNAMRPAILDKPFKGELQHACQ